MSSFGLYSFGLGGLLFALLSVLVAFGWRGRAIGGVLLVASATTSAWALMLAMESGWRLVPGALIWMAEVAHTGLWVGFLMRLVATGASSNSFLRDRLRFLRGSAVVIVVMLLVAAVPSLNERLPELGVLRLVGHAALALIGLVLVEQLFRNSRADRRKNVALLCLGLGGLFAYDLFLYADALLFRSIDYDFWQARGMVIALIAPLIAASTTRNQDWSVDIFVSRGAAFHSVSLIAAGVYLLVMASIGYYLRLFDAEWGPTLQVVFLFGALLVLAVLLFSGVLRARLRVLLNKHFFNYRYDYREEWLRLNRVLAGVEVDDPLVERIGQALAQIVGSPRGQLWLLHGDNGFAPTAHSDGAVQAASVVDSDDRLIAFMADRQWVIDVDELVEQPEIYGNIDSPAWLEELPAPWLLVPLMHRESLIGFVVLDEPQPSIRLNWEDRDLLKTAGEQAAIVIAEFQSEQALTEARQFEGFHRVSAFVMHDLKNLLAQLTLVVKNAERHRDNPDFVDDALTTVSHAVERMRRLLSQLRERSSDEAAERVDLAQLLKEVVAKHGKRSPVPKLVVVGDGQVVANEERLARIIGHVIANAQDATPDDGEILIGLRGSPDQAVVEIEDTGTGMDAMFIQERLFKPFDSTKGLTGMGIGAYEVREYVRQIGGQLDVRSRPGKGTCVRISLPAEPPRPVMAAYPNQRISGAN